MSRGEVWPAERSGCASHEARGEVAVAYHTGRSARPLTEALPEVLSKYVLSAHGREEEVRGFWVDLDGESGLPQLRWSTRS